MTIVANRADPAGTVDAPIYKGRVKLKDGVTAPATEAGSAQLYVDEADGDLKVKFGDGTVKIISADS